MTVIAVGRPAYAHLHVSAVRFRAVFRFATMRKSEEKHCVFLLKLPFYFFFLLLFVPPAEPHLDPLVWSEMGQKKATSSSPTKRLLFTSRNTRLTGDQSPGVLGHLWSGSVQLCLLTLEAIKLPSLGPGARTPPSGMSGSLSARAFLSPSLGRYELCHRLPTGTEGGRWLMVPLRPSPGTVSHRHTANVTAGWMAREAAMAWGVIRRDLDLA